MKIVLIIALLLSLAGCLWLVIFCGMRQDRKKSIYFMMPALTLTFYVVGYLAEIMATTPEAIFTAIRVENVGIPVIAPFLLLMVISVFHPRLMRKWMLPMILTYGSVMWLFVFFNDAHMLYYTDIGVQSFGDNLILAKISHGPLYYVNQVVAGSTVLLSNIIVIRRYFTGSKKLRKRIQMMVIGSLGSFAINVLYFMGLIPGGIDVTPIVTSISLMIFTIVLMRHRQIDLVPIASTNAVRTMEDGVVVLDEQLSLQYWNVAATKLFPSLTSCVDGDSINTLSSWPTALREQTVPGEVTFCLPDEQSTARYFRTKISHVSDTRDEMMGWSYVMRDITDQINMMQQLEEMATTDPLTGIFNRRQFMHMVNHEMEVASRLKLRTALLMYDLDHFKRVNDTYGHTAGDHVLCSVVATIRNQLRPYDIFARYGGEEFVIFTTSNENFDPRAFANRLRESIERTEILYDGKRIKVTASFGVASIKPKGSFEDAMRTADTALYKAKDGGRNRVVVIEEM